MTYLIDCLYRPGGAEERLALRREHIHHMLQWLDRTVFGAALLGPDGGQPKGMVVALNVASEAEARRFVADEPYSRAGLFATVSVDALAQVTPPYTGDVLARALQDCG
ncbi:YciI family protein [Chitinasiproducens palmae]|uniref:YCII-related domain-containing protein n=1 Tax=Chitinasiproducens palmae TaxID=1770053 RepID=A0A1H2PKW0_9BURK|nr:YciI family protein [Chitinasiproducens palmae]SDV47028.1 hypothetical protein SAMN05216551_102204 [Chitinasiproducens palmae]